MSSPRRRRGSRRTVPPPVGADYRRLRNPYTPLRVVSEEQVEQIHRAALDLLARDGMRVLLPEAREVLVRAGASEGDDMVMRFDADLVETALAAAPGEFEVHAREPSRTLHLGGDGVVMVPVAGPPHATDLDRGRRAGTAQDFDDFMRLTQHFDVMHTLAPSVEPQDVPLERRHLHMTASQLRLSDKVPFVYARGRGQVADCLELIRLGLGVGPEEFTSAQRCWTVINTNSPRQLDIPMCMGIIDFAEANQVAVITPFTLSGAMAPVSLAGALTLQHAEALAAITLSQTVRPGAPVLYGAFTSNVDMRSGSPAFGTPEAVKAALASGQLARRVGLPWRSSGVSTSNIADAQSGYETMFNMLGALLGGANMIVHAAGWVESGLAASFEKFILDVEMVQMFAEVFRAFEVDDAEIALDAIADVGPGGHFFGTEHTLERYRTAFYEPLVFGRENFEQWSEAGSQTATQRANRVWKQILADFEPPPLDAAAGEAVDEFVARRIAEGGALPES